MPEGVTPAAPCCVSPMGDDVEVTGARCGGVFAGPRTLVGEDLSAGTMPGMGGVGDKASNDHQLDGIGAGVAHRSVDGTEGR